MPPNPAEENLIRRFMQRLRPNGEPELPPVRAQTPELRFWDENESFRDLATSPFATDTLPQLARDDVHLHEIDPRRRDGVLGLVAVDNPNEIGVRKRILGLKRSDFDQGQTLFHELVHRNDMQGRPEMDVSVSRNIAAQYLSRRPDLVAKYQEIYGPRRVGSERGKTSLEDWTPTSLVLENWDRVRDLLEASAYGWEEGMRAVRIGRGADEQARPGSSIAEQWLRSNIK